MYAFTNLAYGRSIVGIYIILFKPFLLLYLVACVGAVSNICDTCLFLKCTGLPHVLSFVYELLIDALALCFENFIKLSSILSKYFIVRYAFTSLHVMNK